MAWPIHIRLTLVTAILAVLVGCTVGGQEGDEHNPTQVSSPTLETDDNTTTVLDTGGVVDTDGVPSDTSADTADTGSNSTDTGGTTTDTGGTTTDTGGSTTDTDTVPDATL